MFERLAGESLASGFSRASVTWTALCGAGDERLTELLQTLNDEFDGEAEATSRATVELAA